jgi:hypothetical protein
LFSKTLAHSMVPTVVTSLYAMRISFAGVSRTVIAEDQWVSTAFIYS